VTKTKTRKPPTPPTETERSEAVRHAKAVPTVTPAVAALVLGCSRHEAYRMCEAGTLAHIRAGKNIKIPSARLLAMVGIDA
jgi:hypothetical protein